MKVGTDGVLLGSWVSCERLDNILDIGCGTGLITLMLAQRNSISSITGIEIDKLSSEEAKLNVERSSWSNRIEILNTSLQDYRSHTKFDLIVSNPPYIEQNDPHLQQGDVRFEPSSALVAGLDGLDALRIIIEQAPMHLSPNGWLLVEHGYDQGNSVRRLFDLTGFITIFS